MAFYGNGANITSIPSPASLSTASGSAPSYSARAWVNFNGNTNAIRASANVSSITDNGTGDYFVNFSTAISDSNYVTQFSSDTNGHSGVCSNIYQAQAGHTPPTTSSARVLTCHDGGGRTDVLYVCVTIFR